MADDRTKAMRFEGPEHIPVQVGILPAAWILYREELERLVTNRDSIAAIIAAFGCVDYVTVFDEPNVERILDSLKPDVHAKGSDYTEETVPERETVLAYGGRIAIAGGPKIRSASEIIPRVAARLKGAR